MKCGADFDYIPQKCIIFAPQPGGKALCEGASWLGGITRMGATNNFVGKGLCGRTSMGVFHLADVQQSYKNNSVAIYSVNTSKPGSKEEQRQE